MKYYGILPERQLWVKILMLVLAGFVLYREVLMGQWIYVPLVAVVVLACFFQKDHIISDEGVDIRYRILWMTVHNYWHWDEITSLHTDYRKSSPNVSLSIVKDIVTRAFVIKPEDCQAVLALAQKQNPDIFIEDISEEEQERRDAERLHRQEVARAQRAANKRKKKK